jgi:hypothetical protein
MNEAPAQGMKLGSDIGNKNFNAILDLGTGSKGLLLPRIILSSTTSASPLFGSPFATASPAGMSVYNTASNNDVTPGYYYSDGAKWNKVQTSGNSLALGTGATPTNNNTVILSSANVTLPAANLPINKGNVYIIRNISSTLSDISIVSIINFGTTTAANYTLTANEGAVTVVSNGTNWIRIQ